MRIDENCAHFLNVFRQLLELPAHEEIEISKTHMQNLPKCFEKTKRLGYLKDALKQYRGPYGVHIREYQDCYKIHRDIVDPRYAPSLHLVFDIPSKTWMEQHSPRLAKTYSAFLRGTTKAYRKSFSFREALSSKLGFDIEDAVYRRRKIAVSIYTAFLIIMLYASNLVRSLTEWIVLVGILVVPIDLAAFLWKRKCRFYEDNICRLPFYLASKEKLRRSI